MNAFEPKVPPLAHDRPHEAKAEPLTTRLTTPVFLVAALLLLWITRQVWLITLLAITFATMLTWLSRSISDRTPLRRGWALGLVVFAIAGGFVCLGFWFGPAMAHQSDQLSAQLPQAVESLRDWLAQRGWGQHVLDQAQQWSQSTAGSATISRATVLFSSVLAGLAGVVIVIVVTLFFSASPSLYTGGFYAMLPEKEEAQGRLLLDRLGTALRWWLIGRLLSLTLVGVLTGIGLWAIGMPLPWALGLIAALLSFVPNLGPAAAAVPGLLLAMSQGPHMVLWAGLVYVSVQAFESYLITPLIQQYVVSVPPAMLLVVQLALAIVGGIWGLIVATPLMVVVIVTVQTLHIERRLHKQVPILGQNHGASDAT